MSVVLAVALLLLCGNVQSAEEGASAYVTQVRTALETAPAAAPVMAPATTNTTEGSDTADIAVLATEEQGPSSALAMAPAINITTDGSDSTHSAVLSAVKQGQDADLVLVDLARADDENLIDVASAPEPSPSASSIPEGFGMVEAEAPAQSSKEEEAPEPAAAGPDSTAVGERTSFAADSSGEGHLLSGDFPTIQGNDHSRGAGYGVIGGGAGGQSFAATGERTSFAADSSGEGHLLSGDFPTIQGNDHSRGAGYGVIGGGAGGQSFAAMGERTSFAADSSGEGHLLSGDFPTIQGNDHSRGAGYGVIGGGAGGQSFAATGERTSFAADSSGEGHLLSGDFPTIQGNDHSRGAGYGVIGGGAGGQSFAATGERTSFAADSSGEGHLLSGDFPTIQGNDHSRGAGYGVIGGGAGGQSFAEMDEDTASALLEDEATSESNASETTGVTLRKSNTYSPIPKSKATWGKGKCSFYGGLDAAGTMSGACGYGNLYASGYGAYSASLSSVLFKNGMACGACYEVACSGAKSCKPGSVLVTVTNFCAPNPGRSADNGGWCNGVNQHFELSYPAFAKIADPKAGVVALDYRRVPCKKQGGIRFTLNGKCNFNLVTITNVGGSGVVTEVYMKGDKMDWAPLSRNWGANWQCSRNYCGKGISIKIVTSDKKVSVSRLAGPEWAFGKTYIGQQVY